MLYMLEQVVVLTHQSLMAESTSDISTTCKETEHILTT